MRKYAIVGIIISLCLILAHSDSYAFSLNISPPSFKASVKPGESISGTITIENGSSQDTGILAYTQDWLYNKDGSKSFYAAGTKAFSCAKWIQLFPRKFQLEAKGRMAVQYTINMPEEAEGGYYAVIFFESVPSDDDKTQKGMVVRFAGRLGTIVYLETKGKSTAKGTIESVSITPPQSDKPLEMTISFKNTGNVYIGAEGTLNVIDEEGNIFAKERFGPINTLPGDTTKKTVKWLGELEEGNYYAIVTLDIGAEEPLVREVELTISSGGSIEGLSVDTSSEKPEFSVLVKNAGHLNINAGGEIEILKGGKLVKRLSLKKSLIGPRKKKEFKGICDRKLARGMYKARAVISVGAKKLTREKTFYIK